MVVTGRDNLKLILLIFFAIAVTLVVVYMKVLRNEGKDSRERERDVAPAEELGQPRHAARLVDAFLEGFPAELRAAFEGVDTVDKPFSEGQERFLAKAAQKLQLVYREDFRRLEQSKVDTLVASPEPGAGEGRGTPAELRGKLYQIYGQLAVEPFERDVNGIPTICGILRPEVGLGVLSEEYLGFIAHLSGESGGGAGRPLQSGLGERWKVGSWVTFHGYYTCDFYFWNKLPAGGVAPLLVAGYVTHSVPSRKPPEAISKEELNRIFADHDRYFESHDNPDPPVDHTPMEVPPQAFITFAGLALAHAGDDQLFKGARPVFKEMLHEFYERPKELRGERFILQGTVGRIYDRPVGPNPYRIKSKQIIFLAGRYGVLWVDSPRHFDITEGEDVEIQAWFATRIFWKSRRGHGDRLDKPYFVARMVRPFVPKVSQGKRWWDSSLPIIVVSSTLFLIALFSLLLFRDRKRSQQMAATMREIRRKRREQKAREGPPAP